jgi:hypothetical protein
MTHEEENIKLVRIPIGGGSIIEGIIKFPEDPKGIVLIAHGSASNRNSPRNRIIAEVII